MQFKIPMRDILIFCQSYDNDDYSGASKEDE